MSASEVLTDETRARIRTAFGVEPFNVYAATETAGIASECQHHRLHRYEDLVIAEIVDEENRPVAPGEFGAKLLVTVLFSRTQPLIRYELTDRVRASTETCPDGRPFALLDAIEGREEDVLHLKGIAIHPNVFHSALEPVPVAGVAGGRGARWAPGPAGTADRRRRRRRRGERRPGRAPAGGSRWRQGPRRAR